MSAELQHNLNQIDWRESPDDAATVPDPELRDWLTHRGLLTSRLKFEFDDTFQLQVLDDPSNVHYLLDHQSVRKVVLWSCNTPCIYAESYLPEAVMATVPGLRTLGSEPLGETLESNRHTDRSPFEFTTLGKSQLPPGLVNRDDEVCWARRSRFNVLGHELVVAEVFLPGLLLCLRQSGQ